MKFCDGCAFENHFDENNERLEFRCLHHLTKETKEDCGGPYKKNIYFDKQVLKKLNDYLYNELPLEEQVYKNLEIAYIHRYYFNNCVIGSLDMFEKTFGSNNDINIIFSTVKYSLYKIYDFRNTFALVDKYLIILKKGYDCKTKRDLVRMKAMIYFCINFCIILNDMKYFYDCEEINFEKEVK